MSGNFVIVTIIGRIVFYISLSFGFVLFPIFAQKFHQRKDYSKPFLASLFFTLFISVFAALFVNISSDILTSTLWGNDYDISNRALIYYSGAMLVLAVNYQFMQAAVAAGDTLKLIVIVSVIYVVGFSLLPAYGNTATGIAVGVLVTNILAFLLIAVRLRKYMFGQ